MNEIQITEKEMEYLDLENSKDSEVVFKRGLVGWMKGSNEKNDFIIPKGMGFRAKLKQRAIQRQWGGKDWERRNEGTEIKN